MLKDEVCLLSVGTPTISLLECHLTCRRPWNTHQPWTQKAKQPRTGRIRCTSPSSTAVLRKELICGEPSMHRELVDICSPFEVACERMNLWVLSKKHKYFIGFWGVWNLETYFILLLNRFLKWDSFIFCIPTSAIADCGSQPRVADGLWFAISKEDPVAEASGRELALGTRHWKGRTWW